MKPLSGLKFLTLEHFGAGPYGTMFLADLGADVFKIENPETGGDAARRGPMWQLGENDSEYFQGWSTNKRSIALDIKTKEGRAAFDRLVAESDAVINNLRGDQPAKLKIDYASLAAINPRIVCLHISAYGRKSGRRTRPGYDFLMQAEGGLMSLTGDPDRAPARFGVSVIDFMSGITGAVGLLSCIIQAQKTGKGCDVDVSLFDVALHQLNYSATWYLNKGHVSSRLSRSSHLGNAPVQTFKAKDGWVFVMCMTDAFWELLADEFPDLKLKVDPCFASNAKRMENRDALTEVLDSAFAARTMSEWVERLGKKIPIAPVYGLAQALENPFVREVEMIKAVPHPKRPDMRLLANPILINGERLSQVTGSALGADNDKVLGKKAAE